MLTIQPSIFLCHFCRENPMQVVFPGGQGWCFKCYATLHEPQHTSLAIIATECENVSQMKIDATMEVLKVRIVKMLKADGLTISQIEHKLHVTRATIYTYLRSDLK